MPVRCSFCCQQQQQPTCSRPPPATATCHRHRHRSCCHQQHYLPAPCRSCPQRRPLPRSLPSTPSLPLATPPSPHCRCGLQHASWRPAPSPDPRSCPPRRSRPRGAAAAGRLGGGAGGPCQPPPNPAPWRRLHPGQQRRELRRRRRRAHHPAGRVGTASEQNNCGFPGSHGRPSWFWPSLLCQFTLIECPPRPQHSLLLCYIMTTGCLSCAPNTHNNNGFNVLTHGLRAVLPARVAHCWRAPPTPTPRTHPSPCFCPRTDRGIFSPHLYC